MSDRNLACAILTRHSTLSDGEGKSHSAPITNGFRHTVVRQLLVVSWCFKSSQPQRIITGLRKTMKFHKDIFMVQRTKKAEIRPEEQSEKHGELLGEFME